MPNRHGATPGPRRRTSSVSKAGTNTVAVSAAPAVTSTTMSTTQTRPVLRRRHLSDNIVTATLQGFVTGKTPSLLNVEQAETSFIMLARSRIRRFLRFWIAKQRGKLTDVFYKTRATSGQPLNKFSWISNLLLHKNQNLRLLSVDFVNTIMRKKDLEYHVFDELCSLFIRAKRDAAFCQLRGFLVQLIEFDSLLAQRAVKLGVLRSCQAKLEWQVERIVDAEVARQEASSDFVISLTGLVKIIEQLTACKSTTAKNDMMADLHLLRPVVLISAMQLNSVSVSQARTSLHSILLSMEHTPEYVVKETSRIICESVPRLSRAFPDCSFYARVLSVALNELVNVIVPKHKIPDINIQLQRASTQEEYFRSGLAKSTITLKDIPRASKEATHTSPTVDDLKAKIATELGMASSLEMFELVCANKILGPGLELAHVFEQIWRPHVAERGRGGSGMARRLGQNAGSDAAQGRRVLIGLTQPSSSGETPTDGLLYRQITSNIFQLEAAQAGNGGHVFLDELDDDDPEDEDEGQEQGDDDDDDDDEEIDEGQVNLDELPVATLGALASQAMAATLGSDDEEDDEEDDDDDNGGDSSSSNDDEDQNRHFASSIALALSAHHHQQQQNQQRSPGSGGPSSLPVQEQSEARRGSAAQSKAATYVPNMLITYRLCAVDGEATEDFVSTLATAGKDDKKEFTSATSEYSEDALRSLINLVSVCLDNLKCWPFPVAKDLLLVTLTCIDHTVGVNGPELVKKGALPVLLRCLVEAGSDSVSSLCLSVLDRLVSGPSEALEEEGAYETTIFRDVNDEDGKQDQLDWVLERLDSFANKPKLVTALARLVPHLIYGRLNKAGQLAQELVSKLGKPWTLLVIESLSTASDALLLRDALFELGLQRQCVEMVAKNAVTIDALYEHAARSETQLNLRMLKGLVRGHLASARLVCDGPCLSMLVRLEEISSTKVENVGGYAFAVLEALSSHSSHATIRDMVARVQKQRQEELQLLAAKKRQKAMKSLAKRQIGSLSTAASSSSAAAASQVAKKQRRWMDELGTLEEEDSILVCIVCHEGYRSKPHALMCVYTHEKAVGLHEHATFVSGSGSIRRVQNGQITSVMCSTSSFVCIHQTCHESAARTDRSHPKAPKDEWEGAELRNGHVRCNNLMPLRGGSTIARPVYDAAVSAFFERVDKSTRVKIGSASQLNDPSFISLLAHDLRLLLLRVSFGESLVEDTRGGSIESNLKLVVPLMQMTRFLLTMDATAKTSAETLLISCLSESPNAGDAAQCDFGFASCLALILMDLSRWEETRVNGFLRMLPSHIAALNASAHNGDAQSVGSGTLASTGPPSSLAVAAMATSGVGRNRARSRARSLSVAETEGAFLGIVDDSLPKAVRPWLCFFGLVDMIKRTQSEELTDKDALDQATVLAESARTMLSVCQSLTAMAKQLRIDPEELRQIFGTGRSRSGSTSRSPVSAHSTQHVDV